MDSIFGGMLGIQKATDMENRFSHLDMSGRLAGSFQVTSVHAKLMLLEFPDRLRMVITSANMPRRFWEVGMGKTNWDFCSKSNKDANLCQTDEE